MNKQMINKVDDVTTVGAKLAGGFVIFGLTPAEYAGFATAIYFFIQAGYVLWKWRIEIKNVDKK